MPNVSQLRLLILLTRMQDILFTIGSKLGESIGQLKQGMDGPSFLQYCSPSDKLEICWKRIMGGISKNIANSLEELSKNFDTHNNIQEQLQIHSNKLAENVFTRQQFAIKDLAEGLQNVKIAEKEPRKPMQPPVKVQVEAKKPRIKKQFKSIQLQLEPHVEPDEPLDMKLPGRRVEPLINPEHSAKKERITVNQYSKEDRSSFDQYEKELQKLEDQEDSLIKPREDYQGSHSALIPKKEKQEEDVGKISRTHKAEGKHARNSKNQSLFRVNKEATRKYSARKKEEAESHLRANIEFLKYMRGVPAVSQKKEWKQESPQRTSLAGIKESKKLRMQELGFVNSISTHQVSPRVDHSQKQRDSVLPDIRSSRKNAQVFKPTAFSIYSIMKTNEVFTNSPA